MNNFLQINREQPQQQQNQQYHQQQHKSDQSLPQQNIQYSTPQNQQSKNRQKKMSANYLTENGGYLLQNQPSEIQEVSSYQEDDEQSQIQKSLLMKNSNNNLMFNHGSGMGGNASGNFTNQMLLNDKMLNSTNNEIRSQQTMNSNYNNNNNNTNQHVVSSTQNIINIRQNSNNNLQMTPQLTKSNDTSMQGDIPKLQLMSDKNEMNDDSVSQNADDEDDEELMLQDDDNNSPIHERENIQNNININNNNQQVFSNGFQRQTTQLQNVNNINQKNKQSSRKQSNNNSNSKLKQSTPKKVELQQEDTQQINHNSQQKLQDQQQQNTKIKFDDQDLNNQSVQQINNSSRSSGIFHNQGQDDEEDEEEDQEQHSYSNINYKNNINNNGPSMNQSYRIIEPERQSNNDDSMIQQKNQNQMQMANNDNISNFIAVESNTTQNNKNNNKQEVSQIQDKQIVDDQQQVKLQQQKKQTNNQQVKNKQEDSFQDQEDDQQEQFVDPLENIQAAPTPIQDKRTRNHEDDDIQNNDDNNVLSTEGNIERQLQNEIEVTIFDTHPDKWLSYNMSSNAFSLNERKRRRMRRLGIYDYNDKTQSIQDEDLHQENEDQNVQVELKQDQQDDQSLSYNPDEEEQNDDNQGQSKVQGKVLFNSQQQPDFIQQNSDSLINLQEQSLNDQHQNQSIKSQMQKQRTQIDKKSKNLQQLSINKKDQQHKVAQSQPESEVKLRIKEANNDLRINAKSDRQKQSQDNSSPPVSSQRLLQQQTPLVSSKDEYDDQNDGSNSNYSPTDNINKDLQHQQSNNSPQTSSYMKQSTLKQSSVGSLPNSMQWSNQMEKQKQRAENRIKVLDKNQRSQTFRQQLQQNQQQNKVALSGGILSSLQSSQSSLPIQAVNNLNHLQNHPRTSQPSSRIRIGGGIQQRKQLQPLSLQQQPILSQQQQQMQQNPMHSNNNDISHLRNSSSDEIPQNQQVPLPQMTEEQQAMYQNMMMRRERLKNYMIQQRFIQSPYAAHLNFKTFENFFDVEICGGEEKGGKTIYKLKKINPQKKSHQQQMLMWMLQNQQQNSNPQLMVMNGEIVLANDKSQSSNLPLQQLKQEPLISQEPIQDDNQSPKIKHEQEDQQDMILAEGFQYSQGNQNDRINSFTRTNGFSQHLNNKGMMVRNHSQPVLNNFNRNSRVIKTAENKFRRNIGSSIPNQNEFQGMMAQSSQGFLPQNIQFKTGRQLLSGSSERILRSKQEAYMKMGKGYFTNNGNMYTQGSQPQMVQYQSMGNLHNHFKQMSQQQQKQIIPVSKSIVQQNKNVMLNQQPDKVLDENQQYNYTIDLASLNQHQIRNVTTSQAKHRSISQGLQKDSGVNHNFINNNINININHNFTPTSSSEGQRQNNSQLQQAATSTAEPGKIIINTASTNPSNINPIKTQLNSLQNANGAFTSKVAASQQFSDKLDQRSGQQLKLRMTGNNAYNGQSQQFTNNNNTQRNMMNNNFMGNNIKSQVQLQNPQQAQRPSTQGGNTFAYVQQRSLKQQQNQ